MSLTHEIKKADNGIENLILIGMITDLEFFHQIKNAIPLGKFENPEIRTVVNWVIDYFNECQDVPKTEIRNIYEYKKDFLSKDEQTIIEGYLKTLANEYDRPFNIGYVLPKAKKHLRRLALLQTIETAKLQLKKDDINKAEMTLRDGLDKAFKETSPMRDLNSEELVDKWWWQNTEALFRFPGELGDFLHPLRRGKLVAMFGRTKIGKSYWLMEWVKQAVMSKLHVAYFSLEMSEVECGERWSQMIGNFNADENKKETWQPVFDCLLNQTQECTWGHCPENKIVYSEKKGVLEPYDENLDHVVCPAIDDCSDFQPSSWFETWKLEKPTLSIPKKKQRQFENHFGKDMVKFMEFPIGEEPYETMEHELNNLELVDNFIPDVIVVDYADLFKGRSGIEKRFQLNEIWSALSRLAKKKNALVVTATQGSRAGLNKDRITEEDIAEDISKLLIVDIMIAINEANSPKQLSGKDRYWKRQSLEMLAHRYREYMPGRTCLVLNNRDFGQIHIDSKIVH